MKQLSITTLLLVTLTTATAQRVVPFGVGTSVTGLTRVSDMMVWDGKLVFGGNFSSILGNTGESIQAWDGAQFYNFSGAFETPVSAEVICLAEFNGQLVAAGAGASVGNIARWDGAAWQQFDQGYPARVRAMVIFDGDLLIGGDDNTVCAWNGNTWDTLGSRFDQEVLDLAVFEGQLYAGGTFTTNADDTPLPYLARWNGTAWEAVLGGFNARVDDLEVTAAGLAIVGSFTSDASGGTALPYWTVFDGEAFNVPAFAPDVTLKDVKKLSSGELLLRAGLRSFLVRDEEGVEIPYTYGPTVEYNGAVLLGGASASNVPSRAEAGVTRLVQLLMQGEHVAQVDIGAINATVSPSPSMFHQWWSNTAGFEAPKGDTTHAVFAMAPWLYGKQDDVWYSSWPRYGPEDDDSSRWAGPTALVRDSAFYHRYHQVWSVRQEQIDHHAQHFADDDYVMPYVIASWPGNGNTDNGEAEQLAPYADVDDDGLYAPENGDYPLIRGEQAVYWMLHGERNVEGQPALDPLVFDMHVMVYGYGEHTTDEDLRNTVFANFRIINRSGAAYDSLRFGVYADMDIGDYNDDLAECDTTRNLFFTYNADDEDSDVSGVQGYGIQPPAAGVRLLNATLTAHRVWNSGADNTLPFTDAINGTLAGQPFTDLGYATHFQYPGGEWSDTLNIAMPERRNVGSAGPFILEPDGVLCFDVAVVYARATSGGPYASAEQLKLRSDAVQAWYDDQDIVCTEIEDVVGVEEEHATRFAAYPNPANEQLTLALEKPANKGMVVLYDATGSVVQRHIWPTGSSTLALELRTLRSGVYTAELVTPNGRHRVRVVKMQ